MKRKVGGEEGGREQKRRKREVEEEASHLLKIKTHLAKKIRPKELISLEEKKRIVGRENEAEDLLVQIKGACTGMKSTISIVFGVPGSGKTFFANETVKQFVSQQQQQQKKKKQTTTKKKKLGKVHVLSLNGKLHSNQRHALHTLLVQFSEQENRNGTTLSEITKLELTEDDGKGTYKEQTDHISNILKKRKQKKEATILIVDEMDNYSHEKGQKLLYFLVNLHHEPVSLCIIGITSQQNILMGLEKRIRSRINPFPLALSSLSLSHVLSFMSSLLLVDEKGEEWEEEEEEEDGRGYGEFVRKYNKEVESLFESEELKTSLSTVYFRSKSLITFRAMCVSAVSSLTPNAPFPTLAHFSPSPYPAPSSSSPSPSSLSSFLPCWEGTVRSFSETEALIVTAMAKLVKKDTILCTFEQIFSEYRDLAGKIEGCRIYEKQVIEKGFARLISCGVVVWVDPRGKALRRCYLTLLPPQLKLLPSLCSNLPDGILIWMRRWT